MYIEAGVFTTGINISRSLALCYWITCIMTCSAPITQSHTAIISELQSPSFPPSSLPHFPPLLPVPPPAPPPAAGRPGHLQRVPGSALKGHDRLLPGGGAGSCFECNINGWFYMISWCIRVRTCLLFRVFGEVKHCSFMCISTPQNPLTHAIGWCNISILRRIFHCPIHPIPPSLPPSSPSRASPPSSLVSTLPRGCSR